MSRWQAHRATFKCPDDGKTARARRALAFEGRAPLCPKCRAPMVIEDQGGLTDEAKMQLRVARAAQASGARIMMASAHDTATCDRPPHAPLRKNGPKFGSRGVVVAEPSRSRT